MLLDARTFAAKLWPIRFLNRPDFCCVGLNIVYFAKGEPRNVEYGKVFLWKCNIWVIRTRKLPDAIFLIFLWDASRIWVNYPPTGRWSVGHHVKNNHVCMNDPPTGRWSAGHHVKNNMPNVYMNYPPTGRWSVGHHVKNNHVCMNYPPTGRWSAGHHVKNNRPNVYMNYPPTGRWSVGHHVKNNHVCMNYPPTGWWSAAIM